MRAALLPTFGALSAALCLEARADAVALPPLALGNASFMDGVSRPGMLFELPLQYVRANNASDAGGHSVPGRQRVRGTTLLPHFAYLSQNTLLGAHYGAEVLLPLVRLDLDIDGGPDGRRTRQGDLIVSPVNREDERLVLDFPAQYPSEVGSTVELEQALGLPPVDVLGSTDKLLVLLESEEAVRACRPDFAALARLPWRGVIVTARGLQKDFVSRFFAPAMGVDEDPVTGSAHCSLIPYWAQRLNKLSLTAQQCSARGGELWCRLEGERVSIAGHAVLVASGRIRLG
ncbi:PhzF family phenazine biosynthesis protein [Pseudomonas aeruginosa]